LILLPSIPFASHLLGLPLGSEKALYRGRNVQKLRGRCNLSLLPQVMSHLQLIVELLGSGGGKFKRFGPWLPGGNLSLGFGSQLWLLDLFVQILLWCLGESVLGFGSQIWLPDMAPRFGTQNLKTVLFGISRQRRFLGIG
jgi:hypothetical protein